MTTVARAYETDADLRLMQSLQQELWRLEGPRTGAHVGDLAWGASQHAGREHEWSRRLWLDGDRCVAWAWLKRPASLEYAIHVDHRDGALHEEVLDWFEAEATDGAALTTWALESDEVSGRLLARRGYAQPEDGRALLFHVPGLAAAVEAPDVPPGFRLRTVRGEEDVAARVLVHQAVWGPSRVTEESYRDVMRTWPYRPELDCVVEAPDGSFAAYVLCWYDDVNRVGEFEPVGAHQNYRRRGLGAAVCRYALRRLQEEGGVQAIVYADARPDQRQASALYESVGFRRHTRMLELRRT
jgi:GNAT superfamily N-acetyltransferase